jgi:hypothetical protein
VLLIAIAVSTALLLSGCGEAQTERPVIESEPNTSSNQSKNETVADDVFIENDSEADIGEMI